MSDSNDTDTTPLVDAAYYILFSDIGALHHYPSIIKGGGDIEGLSLPMYLPTDAGKTYGKDRLPDMFPDNVYIFELLLDANEVAQNATIEFTVKPQRAKKLPDIFMAQRAIVSDRAKKVIEDYDADLAYFFPAYLSNSKTKEPIAGPWWGCLPKREILSGVKHNFDLDKVRFFDSEIPAGTSLLSMHWVKGALEYLSEHYPLLRDSQAGMCINADLFKHFKNAGLTGLAEIPANARELLGTKGRGDMYNHLKEFISHGHWNRHGHFIE